MITESQALSNAGDSYTRAIRRRTAYAGERLKNVVNELCDHDTTGHPRSWTSDAATGTTP